MLKPLALYAKTIGIVCKNHWHCMQKPLASHVKLPCTPHLEVANPDRGKKRATGRELYPARSPGLSHAAVPRGDGASLSQVMPADIRQCHHCRHSRCQHRERSQSTTTFITLRPPSDATLTIYMPSASDERSRSDTMLPAVIATIPPVV